MCDLVTLTRCCKLVSFLHLILVVVAVAVAIAIAIAIVVVIFIVIGISDGQNVMPFGRYTIVHPSNIVLDRGPGPHGKGNLEPESPVCSDAAYHHITLSLAIISSIESGYVFVFVCLFVCLSVCLLDY